MIELFRRNLFLNSLLLLPYAALLRVQSLLNPVEYVPVSSDSPLIKAVFQALQGQGLWQSVLAIILVFLQAVMINRLVIKDRLTQELTLFPGFFYVLLVSFVPDFLILSPVLIGNTFIILAIRALFTTYKRPSAAKAIFNVGFWIAVASLCYFPFIAMAILGYLGLFILRSFRWMERLQYIVSLTIPFFWVFVWQFWIGQSAEYAGQSIGANFDFHNIFSDIQPAGLTTFIAFLGLIILAVANYNGFTMKKSIQIQQKIDVLYWVLLISVLSLFLTAHIHIWHWIIVMVSLCIFVAMLFLRIKNRMIGEFVHLCLLGLLYSWHFDLIFT